MKKLLLCSLAVGLTFLFSCGNDDSGDLICDDQRLFTFGENTSFTTAQIDTTIIVDGGSVEQFYDSITIPVDTFLINDEIAVVNPDSLFLTDSDVDPPAVTTIIMESDVLERVDSIYFFEPDLLVLVENRSILNDPVTNYDTIAEINEIKEKVIGACWEGYSESVIETYESTNTFAMFLVGTWDIESAILCEGNKDAPSSLENGEIRFDLSEYLLNGVHFDYLTAYAEPVFGLSGELGMSVLQNWEGTTVEMLDTASNKVFIEEINYTANTLNIRIPESSLCEESDEPGDVVLSLQKQ